jgi:putative GTP pyrophosphokinase
MVITVPVYLSNRVVETKVEVQIRTIAMDFWASLEHKIYYKFQEDAPDGIQDELKECAELINFLDRKMQSLNESVHSYQKELD